MPQFNYLCKTDYLPTIQSGQLFDQILDELDGGTRELNFAESWAIGKVYGKISQQYDLDFEFTDTLPFNPTQTYYGRSRVTIDFDNWVAGKEYELNNLCIFEGNGYIYNSAYPSARNIFEPSDWQGIGKQYDIFYIPTPYPIFQMVPKTQRGNYTAGFYLVGDKVWWDNHVYTCIVQTRDLDHASEIQYYFDSDIPLPNVFPNAKDGHLFWKDEGIYEIKDEIPTYPIFGNPAPVWTLGDNRDAVMVQALIDIVIWKLHSRISPMNIPILREKNYWAVCDWLNDVNNGKQNINIMAIEPPQGQNLGWGSRPKLINGY